MNVKSANTTWFRRQDGLSLVELLVVIGIIAILVALLIPVLGRSKENAKRAQCQEALRQIYLATVMYADDNKGYIPMHGGFFAEGEQPHCSSDDGLAGGFPYGGFSYGYWYSNPQKKFDELGPKSAMVSEMIPWHDRKIERVDNGAFSGRRNMLYGDGRVEWVYFGR